MTMIHTRVFPRILNIAIIRETRQLVIHADHPRERESNSYL